ncbi:unnamed protein product [Ostreobium quekettii]|uniref:Glutathione S-transferase n=1 Tax=Ostreobium quekettii TaxID=121088 RepID=A0A8S1J1A7_9CHLO|nr:unnamed protein product [Ostreobium quekettii]|eukprot:evm.model.scf_64.5 EVM.evm.TU.scf_64.5   scf_64:41306-46387(+)
MAHASGANLSRPAPPVRAPLAESPLPAPRPRPRRAHPPPLPPTRIPAGFSDMLADLGKMISADPAGGQSGEPQRDAAPSFEDNAPSWEELAGMVAARRRELDVPEVDLETGPPNPMAMRRMFGQEGPPRIKLYRDHAAWCPYCQKVWMQLEEKRIPYVLEKINMRCYGEKPESFLRITSAGLLPVMEFDGKVVTESIEIAKLLEREFPETPLLPPEGSDRQKVNALLRLERKIFSAWCQFLCNNWGQAGLRRQFESTLDEVEAALKSSGGPYFLGADFSLVDVTFAPFLERMAASLAYYKGLKMRGTGQWPALERWFDEMETRPAYLATRSDYYTHAHALPPQLGGCTMIKEGEPVAAAVDGGAWRLPLPPLSSTSSPEPYSPGDDPSLDRLEAAARLVGNHADVIRFGMRATGEPGDVPVWAPLADPSARPGEWGRDRVDAGFRHVAHALLVGVEEKQASGAALRLADGPGSAEGLAPVYAAMYVRDRVGVPRDLRFPAARQLRAHFNWLIDSLCA